MKAFYFTKKNIVKLLDSKILNLYKQNKNTGFNKLFFVSLFIILTVLCKAQISAEKSVKTRISDRDFPSIFQAWYGIDMPKEFPQTTLEQRLSNAAKHDLLWEEPLSQLGEKVDLVLGLVWDHKNHGLATKFTSESLKLALENKKKMLEINPNMVFLFEVRWRDAPKSFLPDTSQWWLRNKKNNEIVKGWLGGWEPFYMLNYNNPGFQDNVARQCKIAIESGVYDGVMFDWSGNLDIIKKTRASIGDSALIIVNIHDDIKDGMKYAPYINGAFMELNPIDNLSQPVKGLTNVKKEDANARSWENIEKALVWFDSNLHQPRINCNEVWGARDDLARMRAVTTMTLALSDGYALYADPNPLPTPDHYHNWYAFWDVKLGKPLAKSTKLPNNAYQREFEGGTVVYNPFKNDKITIQFPETRKRASDGSMSKEFVINNRDGDIFLK